MYAGLFFVKLTICLAADICLSSLCRMLMNKMIFQCPQSSRRKQHWAKRHSCRAVVIGNRRYLNHQELLSCHKDAEEMATALRKGQFPGRATLELYDATRRGIFRAIDRLAHAVRTGATFTWFHFSGHGVWYNGSLCLVPSDADRKEDYIPVDSIVESLRKLVTHRCLHLITLDCCQTSSEDDSTRASSSFCSRGTCTNRERLWKKLNKLSQSASGHEIFIFHACEKHCAVLDGENPKRSNPFSGTLARLLKEEDLTLSYVVSQVTSTVEKETTDGQRPTVHHTSPIGGNNRVITAKTRDKSTSASFEEKLKKLSEDFLLRIQQLQPRQMNHFLIVCDGIIGCGKTTFLDELSRSMPLGPPEVQIFREPVAEDADNTWWPLLEDFYDHLHKPGSTEFSFDPVLKLEETIWEHHRSIATTRSAHAITERCCSSAVQVFCAALHEQGNLPDSANAWNRFLPLD